MNMKYFAAGAALCALGMAGCSKDVTEEAGTQASQQAEITLRAIADAPQTRAVYTENTTVQTKMDFSWQKGDEISMVVSGVENNKNVKLKAVNIGKKVNFSGTATSWEGSETPVYAFYPYNTVPYTVTGGNTPETATAQCTLPNPQSYTIGGSISNSLMVGAGTATIATTTSQVDVTMGLKQVMSIVKINITNAPDKVTGVKLKSTGETIFPTQASINLSTAVAQDQANKVKELTMTVTDNTDTPTKKVSFAMFPIDLTGKKINIEVMFKNGASQVLTKEGINFERNMHYEVSFDATINWIKEDGVSFKAGLDQEKVFNLNKFIVDTQNNTLQLIPIDPVGSGLNNRYGDPKNWFSTEGGFTIDNVRLVDLKNEKGEGIPVRSGRYDTDWRTDKFNFSDNITKQVYVTTVKEGKHKVSKFKVTLLPQLITWSPNYYRTPHVDKQYYYKVDSQGKVLAAHRIAAIKIRSDLGYGITLHGWDLFKRTNGWDIYDVKAKGGTSNTQRLRSSSTGAEISSSDAFYTSKIDNKKAWITIGTSYIYGGVFADVEVTVKKGEQIQKRLLRVNIVNY